MLDAGIPVTCIVTLESIASTGRSSSGGVMTTVGSSVMGEVPWYEKPRVRDLVQFFSLLSTDNMAAGK